MEDYNKKIQRYPGSKPVDRLLIKATTYGYNLYDRKIEKFLIRSKSLYHCEKGMKHLKSGDLELFKGFVERIKNEKVVTNNVLVCNEKHCDSIYSVPTLEDLYKVALLILEQRFDNDCFCHYDVEKPLDYTLDDIEKMPESLRKNAKVELDRRNRNINESNEVNAEFELVKKAIDEKDGRIAWRIIQDRGDYEYERIELVEPITI